MDNHTRKRSPKPMETCQQILMYMSVTEENESGWKKMFLKSLIIIPFIAIELIGSSVYFFRFMSTDLESSLSALYQIAAHTGILNSVIVTIITRRKLLEIIKSLQKIYDSSKTTIFNWKYFKIDLKWLQLIPNQYIGLDDERFQFLIEANRRSEWIWKIFVKFILISVIYFCILIPVTSVLLLSFENEPLEFDSVYHMNFIM